MISYLLVTAITVLTSGYFFRDVFTFGVGCLIGLVVVVAYAVVRETNRHGEH